MAVMKQFPYFIEKAAKILPFWEGLNEEKFRSTRCLKCNEMHFPPRVLCPKCYSTDIEWIDLPKTGVIETYTYVEIPPDGFSEPYYLLKVIMDELGKPILARYKGEIEPKIGQKVTMMFEQVNDQKIPVFVPT